MTFQQELIITLIDKLAIGALLLLGGYLLNRLLKSHESREALENEKAKLRDEKRLEFLERQLCEFYWPLYIRLEKDRCIWKKILDINSEKGSLVQKVGLAVETRVILPNHEAMIALIETHIHLAQADKNLTKKLMEYIRLATEYQALRDAGDTTQFSITKIGSDWLHQDLFDEIKDITDKLQSQYDDLIRLSATRENLHIPPPVRQA
jgi:uncharacterized protein (DUF2164 family)